MHVINGFVYSVKNSSAVKVFEAKGRLDKDRPDKVFFEHCPLLLVHLDDF